MCSPWLLTNHVLIWWSNAWFSWCFKVFFIDHPVHIQEIPLSSLHISLWLIHFGWREWICYCTMFHDRFSCWSIASVRLVFMDFEGNEFCLRLIKESQKNQMIVAVVLLVTCGKNETFRSQFLFTLQFQWQVVLWKIFEPYKCTPL